MTTSQTGSDDVTFALVSLQYHSLKAGHRYAKYAQDARTAGREDVAGFFEQVQGEDEARAQMCQHYLGELSANNNLGADAATPQQQPAQPQQQPVQQQPPQ